MKHGTLSGYQHYHCRCDFCKEAMRKWQREYYARNKDNPVWNAKYRKWHAASKNGKRSTPEGKKDFNKAIRERRLKFGEIKLKIGCKICGYKEHHAALDFHHKNGKDNKTQNITKLCTYSWKRVLEEIKGCDVLCSNCHRIVTFQQSAP